MVPPNRSAARGPGQGTVHSADATRQTSRRSNGPWQMARERHGGAPGSEYGNESAMSIDTPAWVKDAVFYQIFPDRFASSARVPKPGPGAMGQPADHPRVQGRRPAGHRRASHLPRGARGQRDLPEPDLPVGVQPPLSHVRLPQGGPAAGRRRRPARAARRGPRPRHAGRPGRRLQPRRPRVLAVPPRARDGRRIAVPGLVPLDEAGLEAVALRPYPRPRPRSSMPGRHRTRAERGGSRSASTATRPGGACPPCPS